MTRSFQDRATPWAMLLMALVVLSLICVPASAQVLYGSIVGTVGDPTGAVIPGATVKVTNTATGLSRETTTDAQGRFSIPSLLPGTYDISASSTGFSTMTQSGVSVTINTVSRADLRMQVGQVSEQVTVSGTAPRAADREIRRPLRNLLPGDDECPAPRLPQPPDPDESGSRRNAGGVPERGGGYPRTRSDDEHQRHRP